jgi:acetolactate synthase-1/2/3 large subunit
LTVSLKVTALLLVVSVLLAPLSVTALEYVCVPVVVTWGALDLMPRHDPQCTHLGAFGVYGSRVANFAVQNADLLICVGARLDTRQTGGKLPLFSRESVKVIVDVDESEVNKLRERGVSVAHAAVGDAAGVSATGVANANSAATSRSLHSNT